MWISYLSSRVQAVHIGFFTDDFTLEVQILSDIDMVME